MDADIKKQPSTNPLESYFYNNRKNIVHKWQHYFDIYHAHFKRYIGTDCIVLEIGVGQGGSLQMWKNYFGNKATIYGLDINPSCKDFEEENISIFIGSQSDRNFLKHLKMKIPKVDILIDDGGHMMDQQIISFEELFEHVKDDGIYLCEDVHTSYWEEYDGGLNKPGSFVEFSKKLIDKLHAWHIRNGELSVSEFTRDVGSLHFYDSVFVLEKKIRVQPWHVKKGTEKIKQFQESDPVSLAIFKLKLNLLGMYLPETTDFESVFHNPSDIESLLIDKYEGKSWPKVGETMIGYKRLNNVEFCMNEILKNNIDGDVIETGVWRGGTCILMRAILKSQEITNRKVWVADSFEGLPCPNPVLYPEDLGDTLYTFNELIVSIDEVKNNFKKYNLLDEQVVFLKGWFKDTISSAPIEKLSILRLDGDMYESTIDVLFHLYPKLAIGGYCIIDDWGAIPACKKAVEDYRRVFSINDEIQVIDWTGIFWKKQKESSIISRKYFNDSVS